MVLCTIGSAGAQAPIADRGDDPFIIVLGVAQDGGYPQIGCRRKCCQSAWADPQRRRNVVSLGVVDPSSGERWLVECTPDVRQQLRLLDEAFPSDESPGISGIFLTHAHIGHYAGLIHLGREAIGAKQVPVFAMPRMSKFLRSNGPWSQLVELKNIELKVLEDGRPVRLNDRLEITPILVPHRDEFSETVAFRIRGPGRSVLFLPDIDQWDRWERAIEEEIALVDIAYLDATFFDGAELPGRDLSEIPHPLVADSLTRFGALDAEERAKIHFIHCNHTNPLLDPDSAATRQVRAAGMHVAEQGNRLGL
jgi:pyrroloquinoline quinone biosynthesis protein B